MALEKNIYKSLLDNGYSKEDIHQAIHSYFTVRKSATHKNLIPIAKKIRLNLLSGFALSLLKTLFIKKPKNPV